MVIAMMNRRIEQLSVAYSHMTGETIDNSRKKILSTPTGRAIQRNDPYVMYDQQTANLFDICTEIPGVRREDISTKKIVESVNFALSNERIPKRVVIKSSVPGSRNKYKKVVKSKMSRVKPCFKMSKLGRG